MSCSTGPRTVRKIASLMNEPPPGFGEDVDEPRHSRGATRRMAHSTRCGRPPLDGVITSRVEAVASCTRRKVDAQTSLPIMRRRKPLDDVRTALGPIAQRKQVALNHLVLVRTGWPIIVYAAHRDDPGAVDLTSKVQPPTPQIAQLVRF